MENLDERRDLIVSRVLRFVQNIVREAEGQTTDIASFQDRAESFYGHVLRLTQAGVLVETVPDIVRDILLSVFEIYEDVNQTSRLATSVIAPTIRCARRGRPRYLILEDTLTFLVENGFTARSIAEMLCVSLSTVRRRMRECGLYILNLYSSISDEELDLQVIRIKQEFPNSGSRMLRGHLLSYGLRVQQKRIRESLRRIDPEGCALRWFESIHRRTYSVPHSQALWHIDSNHKLIRWRFVLHGCIDGFSRVAIYIHCSDDNRSSTVLRFFIAGATEFGGLPSRVRCDKGSENRLVALHMLTHKGIDRGSVLVGRSVHNQRIERLWRDVWQGVNSFYYHLFRYMENEHLLNPCDEMHLFCLHFVYLPRINRHLQIWREAWNNHPVSSCHGKTPLQLWLEGRPRSEQLLEAEVDENNYGISWDDPVSLEEEDNTVEVPQNEFTLDEERLGELTQSFDPLSDDGNYGIDHYCRLLEFSALHLNG